MRAVRTEEELRAALGQARSEAAASFGEGSVYLEKVIDRARHIEVQLFGDGKGHVVHLGERECSLQRRYQKVVEESPAPGLPDDVRVRLCQAAVRAAAAARYGGAGTIEFLYEPSSGEFYFLEMNARLQVEHPVTELVTGVDLVKAQLRLAGGAGLEEALGERRGGGHAIEVRVSAEDPHAGWIPSTGRIALLREPAGPGIRVDSACEAGLEVTPYYDPLLAKLIAYGRTRREAIDRLGRALGEYLLTGVQTTLPFHRWVVRDVAFRAGDVSIAFIGERWKPDELGASKVARELALAAVEEERRRARTTGRATHGQPGQPAMPNGWSPWRAAARTEALR